MRCMGASGAASSITIPALRNGTPRVRVSPFVRHTLNYLAQVPDVTFDLFAKTLACPLCSGYRVISCFFVQDKEQVSKNRV
jgi:hypothetical protein